MMSYICAMWKVWKMLWQWWFAQWWWSVANWSTSGQSTKRTKKKKLRESTPNRCKICVMQKKKRVFYKRKGPQKYRWQTARLRLWGSHTSTVQATEVHAKILLWYIWLLLHSKWQYKSQAQEIWKWVTVTLPDDLFKHGIDIDYKQMDRGKTLNLTSNYTTKILPSTNSEIKHSMQATTYIWTANCQKQNAYIRVLVLYVGMLYLFWITWLLAQQGKKCASHLNLNELL